jgi:hypothetical protein
VHFILGRSSSGGMYALTRQTFIPMLQAWVSQKQTVGLFMVVLEIGTKRPLLQPGNCRKLGSKAGEY